MEALYEQDEANNTAVSTWHHHNRRTQYLPSHNPSHGEEELLLGDDGKTKTASPPDVVLLRGSLEKGALK